MKKYVVVNKKTNEVLMEITIEEETEEESSGNIHDNHQHYD